MELVDREESTRISLNFAECLEMELFLHCLYFNIQLKTCMRFSEQLYLDVFRSLRSGDVVQWSLHKDITSMK